MNEQEENKISLDILKHVEDLSSRVNERMAPRAETVFRRYPVTFGLLILLGVIALHEGLKGIMEEFGLLEHPLYLIIIGLAILIITGTIYKKLQE